MKKEKILLIVISSILIISNALWILNKYRTSNRALYNATYICEQKELIYSLRTFQVGLSFEEFKTILTHSNMKFNKKWENKERLLVEVKNIFSTCPSSGRPYCGIYFEFESNHLINITSGYPCH